MNREESVSAGHIPEIDGIRALAVGTVIVFHLWPGALPGGFTGVDMFFVVSGFVVTRSLLTRDFASFRALALDFYARRAVRILPALIVMLLATLLAAQLFVPQGWLARDPSHVGLAALFGVSNLVLVNGADGYFEPLATLNPFTHTWSLGVEEQFYLAFPLLLYWSRRGPPARMLWVIGGLSLLSLTLAAWFGATQPRLAFYSIVCRFWELGAGVLLCTAHATWRARLGASSRPFRAVFAAVSVAAIAAGLGFAAPGFFPFPLALLPVLGTAGLIATVCSCPELAIARLLRSGPATFTGRLSYSLYLWHWPVLVLFRWTVGLDSLALQLAALAVSVVLAHLSYRLVERPLRTRARHGKTARGGILRIALGSVMLAFLTGTVLLGNRQHLSLSVTRDRASWYAEPDRPLDPGPANCALRQEEASIAGGSRIGWSPENCRRAGPASKIIVLGDSHGVAYTPNLRQFAAESGARIVVYFRAHCPFLELLQTMASRPGCRSFYKTALDEVRASASAGDVIFFPGLRLHHAPAAPAAGRDPLRPAEAVPPEAIDEALALLRLLGRKGAAMLFEAPKPLFQSPAYRCADWFNRNNPVCRAGLAAGRNELLARRRSVVAAMRTLADAAPAISVWDPFADLCPEDPCRAMRGDKPLFFDGDHLSGYGNSLLYPAFRRALLSAHRSVG
ncbi:acyltransferase family protein [Sphingomonas psychrotolerans]|uniref:acyltransferase family protein n=1 Tax=Sphingomonas psychrotolerans TaxID=1327635 RepID=UPI00130508EC|nr:acyltransferase family protein [Sphingomonas psychrotolerans]